MSEYIINVEQGDYELFSNIANMYGEVRSIGGEIVRCKDCVWAKRDQSDYECRCNMWITDVSADGYCYRGMRKEGGE